MSDSATKLIELSDKALASGGADLSQDIGVASSLTPEDVIRYVHETGVLHVVQRDSLAFASEILVSQAMMSDPAAFLNTPLDIVLGTASSSETKSFEIKSQADEKKTKTLVQFENFLTELKGARTVVDDALAITDELYTNAAKSGAPLKSGRSQAQGMVEFFARSEAGRLVFGCRDLNGDLDLKGLVARLNRCYEQGLAKSINYGTGGAGIGSFMVFNSAISYYAGVQVGRRTVVCVALPLGIGRREFTALPKNIHLASCA